MSEEKDKLLDHDYDGIKEFDNPLPKWWLYLFYCSIVFAIIYVPYIHFFGGKTIHQEYEDEVAQHQAMVKAKEKAEEEVAAKQEASEGAVTTVAKADPVAGKNHYMTNCASCHGMKGEGGIGPNLVDKYWLHTNGAKVDEIAKIIRVGVAAKGMPGWEPILGVKKIDAIAAYIMTIQGTNPANAKAPQGKEY